mmetsp:Transcript_11460/g.26905  ORF Transcript_11460/g.26905 Transcript_11460/m.26905 type:complete len:531 (+) Transcript_11460:272-1864(+)
MATRRNVSTDRPGISGDGDGNPKFLQNNGIRINGERLLFPTSKGRSRQRDVWTRWFGAWIVVVAFMMVSAVVKIELTFVANQSASSVMESNTDIGAVAGVESKPEQQQPGIEQRNDDTGGNRSVEKKTKIVSSKSAPVSESVPSAADGDNTKSAKIFKQERMGDKNATESPLEIHMRFNDPPIIQPPVVYPDTRDFDPSIPGVVVTKIHGSSQIQTLKKMLCLFTKAYNDRVHRDIIVFTSEALEENETKELREMVSPAKLSVEVDNPGLHKMVNDLSLERLKLLFDRCGVQTTSQLSWYTKCYDETSNSRVKGERIAYTWQTEFRALWLWTHPALKPYKYMMWMDSDVYCTRVWHQDPIAAMERYDLALLFDHFPQGRARGMEFPQRSNEAFDRTICEISMVNGTLVAEEGRCINKKRNTIQQVHGFFHVSSLDFYRSDAVMKWNRALIGDSKFSRLFDDQIGITMPAAVLAGNRSRDMRSLGVYTRVFHNFVIDGRMEEWRGNFKKWWAQNANTSFPEALQCPIDRSE